MPKKYDVVAITGEYNGKPKYKNVGLVIEKDGKFYLKMESLVTPHENGSVVGFFSLFTPRPKEEQQPSSGGRSQQSAPSGASHDEFDDQDIPF